MSIDSKLWSLRSYNDAYVHILQRASGVMRTTMRSKLPPIEALSGMSERQFDTICREAFVHAPQG